MMLDMNKGTPVWPAAAMRSMFASKWELWLARIFGTRVEAEDSGYRLTAYRFFGKLYITKVEHDHDWGPWRKDHDPADHVCRICKTCGEAQFR